MVENANQTTALTQQWLTEIQTLKQQLIELQQDRDAAWESAQKWRQLYNKEAEQRRTDAQLSQQAMASLKADLHKLQGIEAGTLAATPVTAIQEEIAQLVQLLYASMMKMEAKAAGVDDCWLVEGDVITEGTSQNACIITPNGHLVTRDLGHHILPGVTRLSLIDIARASGITVEERPFTIAEAQGAAEAFVTSASLFVMPVVEIDGLSVGDGRPGFETMALRRAYIEHARAQG